MRSDGQRALRGQAMGLKARALRALAQREYTVLELMKKLQAYEEYEGQLQALVSELQQKGLLSDARAIQSHLHRRASKWGMARIGQELVQKGADEQKVEEAMASLAQTEFERALLVWKKKFGHLAGPDAAQENDANQDAANRYRERSHAREQAAKERAKQIRFLLGRGFSMQIVQKVLQAGDVLE